MGFSLSSTGSFKNTERYLRRMSTLDAKAILERHGQEGVYALSQATPKETGETAYSWYFDVEGENGSYTMNWHNSHVNNGQKIAILIQYGHGTGTGGYVQGRDYINPALRPIFDKIAEDVWKAVTSA